MSLIARLKYEHKGDAVFFGYVIYLCDKWQNMLCVDGFFVLHRTPFLGKIPMYRIASHALYLMHNLSTFAKEKYMYQQPKRHIGRKFAIGCGALVALVVLIAVIAAVANSGNTSTSTSSSTQPTSQPTRAATIAPTPTLAPTKKPTPAPTHQPTQLAQLAITFSLVDSLRRGAYLARCSTHDQGAVLLRQLCHISELARDREG